MSNVIHLVNHTKTKASGVFAVVNIAARRMGYPDHLAARAARLAKREVLDGHKSPARAVSDMRQVLRLAARNNPENAA